jgi:hypothetical protein
MTKEQLDVVRQRFLADVSRHEMVVLHDEGVHRQIRFRKPDGEAFCFDLITWPERLCIDSAMGAYVFAQDFDMIDFFRADPTSVRRYGADGLFIDEAYWAGKLLAADPQGVTNYDPEMFRACVRQDFENWCKANRLGEEQRAEIWQEIENDVLASAEFDEHSAREAASNFRLPGYSLRFEGFWERDLRTWAHNYIWCCYAIAWGVTTYDEAKTAARGAK